MLMKAAIEVLNTPSNGSYWTAGETILYDYILTNDTNTYFYDIDFIAKLTGETMVAPDLVPGEVWSLEATTGRSFSYTITEEDVTAGKIIETLFGTWEEGYLIRSASVSNTQWTNELDLPDIPIVPNLYEAPLSPEMNDCYYNIAVDKYYIYDGTQWLQAKAENETNIGEGFFVLKYSQDGGETFTTESYDDFDALVTKMNSNVIQNATDISITPSESSAAILIPRKSDTSLDGVALLTLKVLETKDIFELKYSEDNGETFTTELYDNFDELTEKTNSENMLGVTDISISMIDGPLEYNEYVVGKVYPKIIFNQQLVENLVMNTQDTYNSYFDGVLVFNQDPPEKTVRFKVTYKVEPTDDYITEYCNDVSEVQALLIPHSNHLAELIIEDEIVEEEEEGG